MSKKTWADNHPSVTKVDGKLRLKVFEEPFVEEDLPKFKKLLEEDMLKAKESSKNPEVAEFEMAFSPLESPADGAPTRISDTAAAKSAKWDRTRYVRLRAGTIADSTGSKGGKGAIAAINKCLRTMRSYISDIAENEPVSVEETFRLVKEDEMRMTTEDILRSRAIASALVERFASSCQFGMAKKVEGHLDLIAAKLNLAQHDMCKYITEDQAIEFIRKAERGVQVEYLRYYPEVVPNEVAAKIAECNANMLFDNYVVMFYSTNTKPARLLEDEIEEAERAKRRDPILFGTLRGCRDLFYVCDWVYGDDDMKLSDVEKAIGTIPTLKDERIADSQYRLMSALHDLRASSERAFAEAKDRGYLLPIPEETVASVGM